MIDPSRSEVADAIATARAACITVIMITGGSPITARAIAEQLSLNVSGELAGHDLDEMDDAALTDALAGDALFAFTKPEQKMRIVSALQAREHASRDDRGRC